MNPMSTAFGRAFERAREFAAGHRRLHHIAIAAVCGAIVGLLLKELLP